MSIERQCKCGSYAINDDPEGKKCDNCFGIAEERRKYAQVCAELARLRALCEEAAEFIGWNPIRCVHGQESHNCCDCAMSDRLHEAGRGEDGK